MNYVRDLISKPRPDRNGVSFWMDQLGATERREPFATDERFDVVVIGGGLTGLWTAYYLACAEPALTIGVFEAQQCGFGPSGRNGGWCNAGSLGLSLNGMRRRWGDTGARQVTLALRATLGELDRVIDGERMAVDIARDGALKLAHGPEEIEGVEANLRLLQRLDLLDGHRRLSAEDARAMLRAEGVEGALFDPFVHWINPAELVRALMEAVEKRGVRIFEDSYVSEWREGDGGHVLSVNGGSAIARKLILATEAYTTQWQEFRRRLAPMYSFISITEPLTSEQMREIGWNKRYTFGTYSLTVDYCSRTKDNRVAVGGRGARYRYASKVSDEQDRDAQCHRQLQSLFRDLFPQLSDVRFTDSWGGVLGVPRDWVPNVWFDAKRGLGAAYGFTGQGNLTSNLAGRIFAQLMFDASGDERDLPFVGHRSRAWEPEPLRWLGIRAVQHGLDRVQRRAKRTGLPPSGRSVSEILSRH